jgi:DNA-binding transcriptional MerR regulator
MDTGDLRPIERRILSMRDEGVPLEEIGKRLRKSPEFVARVIDWTQIPRSNDGGDDSQTLTPLERRVLQLREEGEDYDTIGERFKKGARFIRQVEGMAHFRKGLSLLSASAEAARAGRDNEPNRD